MNCPGPEQGAAYADGRLDAADAARYLEHCSECEDCRRTLALLSMPRESSGVPAAMEARVIASLRRSIDGERDRTPRPMRRLTIVRAQSTPAGFIIAAALLVGFVGLVLMAKQPRIPVPEPRIAVTSDSIPAPAPAASRQIPVLPAPEAPKLPPAPKEEVVLVPSRLAPRIEEPKVETPAEPVARETPKIEETRVEEPPRAPVHTASARTLTELQVTDITGALSVHRKGAKSKERLSGVARLAEGDVVSADKPASFQVEGRHPVVLSENTSISMAYVAQEQAPWLRLHSGEVMVDSTGSARWVVTDGLVAVAVKPARARFTASRGDARLALASLSEPLYVQPDGGQIRAIHLGEEFQVGKSVADVRPLDAGTLAKKNAAFDAARPRQRTIFYTSCDPADAKREHFFVQEGGWQNKVDGLLSRERPDRTAAAAIGPNPRFSWRDSVVLRFRYMTNCKSMETQLRVDERKYTLIRNLPVERARLNQWISVEIPLALGNWPSFKRDDGSGQLVVSTEDKFDSIRFVVKQSDVFGDAKPYVLIDDIQVFEREKE